MVGEGSDEDLTFQDEVIELNAIIGHHEIHDGKIILK